MQAAILAGGLGTRLHPMTHDIPKAMVPIAGKPFLERQIALLRANGVVDIVLLVGHLADVITDFFGDGERFGVKIRYSNEGATLLDTGGAVRQAMDLLDEKFFVTFADSYIDLPYREIWEDFSTTDHEALMVVYRNDNKFDTSDVFVADGLVQAYQKSPPLPGAFYINDGLMIFRHESLKSIAAGTRISLQSFLQPIIARCGLMAWETEQRFFEIGSFSGLKELEERFELKRNPQ